jgi:hypothetical protein
VPVPLYLHGSPWSVASSALRARRMHELGVPWRSGRPGTALP